VAVAIGVVSARLGRRLPAAVRRRAGWVLLAMALLSLGLITGYKPSNIDDFGGLLLTIVVALTSIAMSFPIGVVLALARRSSFPLIRPLAVTYIELIRGVPLVALLFMGQFALGFLFPPGVGVPGSVPRAIAMITFFSAAYVAEVVRGGLQSVPAGQVEAGKALGLSAFTITRRIVLPQALRNSIPALIGQFISLLKDVSLLVIIGLQEMLGMVDVVLARREFTNQGYTPEAYAFVGIVYWTLCFSMSRAAQRLETRLGVGTR
jgi:general L-amino acid transport system permease protein